jgi:CRISPR-associated protein Cas1
LNPDKTRIVDFEHGFQFLGALFEGNAIWVPRKHERRKGRILFMARPMPLGLRTRYDAAPPRKTMELALLRAQATTVPAAPRIPTGRPAVAYLYLTEQGAVLRKSGDRFLVEKDDEILLDLPYHKLESVLLFGNIQVTTQAMAELLEKGVNLSLFSRQGMYRGALEPARGKNVDLRLAQFEHHRDAQRSLATARALVAAKIRNGLSVLARYREKNEVTPEFEERRKALEESAATAAQAPDIAALDGVEGAAARNYFALLMQFNRSGLEWPGRVKHPATDPLNALLSLTYTLLMQELGALLEGAGLDPYVGFLHQIDYGRPSLALDLMEAFRHPVADRLVLTLVNRKVLEAEDFSPAGEGKGVFLQPKAMKRFFAQYEQWMLDRPGRDQAGPRRPHFRDSLKREVEKLVQTLRAAEPFLPYAFDAAAQEEECSTSSVTI